MTLWENYLSASKKNKTWNKDFNYEVLTWILIEYLSPLMYYTNLKLQLLVIVETALLTVPCHGEISIQFFVTWSISSKLLTHVLFNLQNQSVWNFRNFCAFQKMH